MDFAGIKLNIFKIVSVVLILFFIRSFALPYNRELKKNSFIEFDSSYLKGEIKSIKSTRKGNELSLKNNGNRFIFLTYSSLYESEIEFSEIASTGDFIFKEIKADYINLTKKNGTEYSFEIDTYYRDINKQ